MINIVTFKWEPTKTGHKLKSPVTYSAEHVNILYNSIKRNTTLPFKFTCVTDNPTGLHKDIHRVQLWDKCKYLGGCYNRLYVFSKDMKDILGERFACIDLDVVVTGNLDSILSLENDFVINKFISTKSSKHKMQFYNGAFFMMNAGARSEVWDKFKFQTSVDEIQPLKDQKKLIGSDQAWISYLLGSGERVLDTPDGSYDISFIEDPNELPANSKLVFFHGKTDPSVENYSWIKENWK